MSPFKGVFTALITPFHADGTLNEEGLRSLIRRQINHGIDGILLLGTTGESPTLTTKERKRIIAIGREEISEQTCLMVGTGSYSTAQTIEMTKEAEDLGADAALVVTPYYNKPTQEGLFQHFREVSKATELPLVVYNIAGRTAQNLQTETLRRLVSLPNIMGIKESSGNITQIMEVMEAMNSERPEFSVMSGDDALTLPVMALGGVGVYSVLSNLMPEEVMNLVSALSCNDYEGARRIHFELLPIVQALFIETNPIPIKAAMGMSGLPSGPCRLPLIDLSAESTKRLKVILPRKCLEPV